MFDRAAREAHRLAALTGARRLGAAVLLGAAAALAMAPFYLTPLMILAYGGLILLIDGARAGARPRRAAFAVGWAFGFGFHLLGLYWLAFSFFVQAEEFAWMAPFAVLGMPAFLGLFPGAAAAAYAGVPARGARRVLAFAAIFALAEYARGHVLTGLPWNLPGQALAGTAAGAQTAAWWGVYGLSLVALAIALAPAAWIDRGGAGLRRGTIVCVASAAALFAIGGARLLVHPPEDQAGVMVRVVQPNIPQREKIDNEFWWRNLDRHIALSAKDLPPADKVFILWPENAAPILDEIPDALALIAERLPARAVLVAGAVRREVAPDGGETYFNSIGVFAQVGDTRRAIAHYDKHHLVPFGEYLPLQGALRALGLAQLAPYDDGFARGAGPQTIAAIAPAFAPLVCYEAIFPGRVYPRGARPQWIATVTNDAWFGDSSGPRQHLDQARLRAIETGLPMARAANTGVSAIIDPVGRYRGRVKLYAEGVADSPLPAALPQTLYAAAGDALFALLAAAALGLGVLRAPSKR